MGGLRPGPRLPTISKSALLLSPCTTWAGQGARWYDESKRDPEDTVARDDGILFHDRMDLYNNSGPIGLYTDKEHINRWLDLAVAWTRDHLWPRCNESYSEVAVAINWSTGNVYELNGVRNREYPRDSHPGCQFGTADLMCHLKDNGLLIADWKTGGNDGAEEQLLSLACAFDKLYPGREVSISCISVNSEGVWPHERKVSKEELASHWDAMAFTWEDVIANRVSNKPEPGIHCTKLYCPHLAYCTAISDGIRKAAAMDSALREAQN